MERELIRTITDKKVLYNAMTGVGNQMKDHAGTVIECKGIIQFPSARKETGEEGVCTVLMDASGELYTTMSPTVDDCAHAIIDVMGSDIFESDTVELQITSGTSKGGREFLQLKMV